MSKQDRIAPLDGRRNPDKGYWAMTAISGDVSVYAWERLDRHGIVHLKYTSGTSGNRDHREKRKLPGDYTVRDDRGHLDKALVADVEARVHKFAARLALGQDPFAPEVEAEPEPGVLTLHDAFELALNLETGKFPTASRRYDELKRAQRKLERILGARIPMEEALDSSHVREVWRTLARAAAKAGDGSRGVRQAEVTVDALYSVGRWLEAEEHLPERAVRAIDQWRRTLKQDWMEITKANVTSTPEGPRHSEGEMRRLFAALGDPRRRLFRVLQRAFPEGALADARWQGLEFDRRGIPVALTVHWMQRGRTAGVPRDQWPMRPAEQRSDLDERARAAVAAALAGYLRRLERARHEGTIADYPLFPDGTILDGAITLAGDTMPLPVPTELLLIDERFELAFELGGEQRMGQVLRSLRSHLTLPGIDERVDPRVPTLGQLVPPPARKKTTQPIALTPEQRAWVADALAHGYLHEFEAAYRTGRIRDYPLFPALRLVRGVALFRADAAPLSRDAALKMFRHLEAVAGVPSLPGRGWYGVRRIAADVVEDVAADERVQDAVLANSATTRRRVYQEKRRRQVIEGAADVRTKMRGRDPAAAPVSPDLSEAMRAFEAVGIALTPAQLEALGALAPSQTGTDRG